MKWKILISLILLFWGFGLWGAVGLFGGFEVLIKTMIG